MAGCRGRSAESLPDPPTHFADPAGDAWAKTRSWCWVKDAPLFAWADFCRNVPDHGPLFAGMTTETNQAMLPYYDRMPVLLVQSENERWLHGSVSGVIECPFRKPTAADRIAIAHTADRWRSGVVPHLATRTQMALI